MKIIDTFENIKDCYRNGSFDKELWNCYMERLIPSVKPLCEADVVEYAYDFDKDILPFLNTAGQSTGKLQEAHEAFVALTEDLEQVIARELQTELDLTVVFYLGLCNGAGWVVDIGGKTHILLGIEKIVELDWQDRASMAALLYHELGHAWHFAVRERVLGQEKEPQTQKEAALWQLYTEGVAMYCEQRLSGDDVFSTRDRDGWFSWCQTEETANFGAYLQRVEDEESVQDFFGDWARYRGRPDVGYYLGCAMVKKALQQYSVERILTLNFDEIEVLLRACAAENKV